MSVFRESQLFRLTSLSYRAECEITYVIKPNNSGGHDMVRPGHQQIVTRRRHRDATAIKQTKTSETKTTTLREHHSGPGLIRL